MNLHQVISKLKKQGQVQEPVPADRSIVIDLLEYFLYSSYACYGFDWRHQIYQLCPHNGILNMDENSNHSNQFFKSINTH